MALRHARHGEHGQSVGDARPIIKFVVDSQALLHKLGRAILIALIMCDGSQFDENGRHAGSILHRTAEGQGLFQQGSCARGSSLFAEDCA